MTLGIDLARVIAGDKEASNFGAMLCRLILKADEHNLSQLRKGFPNAVKLVEEWRVSGKIPADKSYD